MRVIAGHPNAEEYSLTFYANAHLTTTASTKQLAEDTGNIPGEINTRCNILVETNQQPYSEKEWLSLLHDAYELHCTQCKRCTIMNNYKSGGPMLKESGKLDPTILAHLIKNHEQFFGNYISTNGKTVVVKIGDLLEILQTLPESKSAS